MFGRYSPRWTNRGFTLIEVLAAVGVLAMALGGFATARSRALNQWGMAEKRLAAVELADDLMVTWSAGSGVAPGEQGDVDSPFAMVWRTQLVSESASDGLPAAVVRLSVWDADSQPGEALVTVDVLIPAPEPAEEEE